MSPEPIVLSWLNQTWSRHEPVAGALPALLTVHEKVAGCVPIAPSSAETATTPRSGRGGSDTWNAPETARLFDSFGSSLISLSRSAVATMKRVPEVDAGMTKFALAGASAPDASVLETEMSPSCTSSASPAMLLVEMAMPMRRSAVAATGPWLRSTTVTLNALPATASLGTLIAATTRSARSGHAITTGPLGAETLSPSPLYSLV